MEFNTVGRKPFTDDIAIFLDLKALPILYPVYLDRVFDLLTAFLI